ncbi:response regulator [uncultured Sutterella sp.]|uniref:response regulator transcription factor n=1 Tax=uncultured Sutterella sp. TaxID=286133 RepID=UPI002611C54F|nr:response regulator [uncultured Sutterella sp.]
MAQMKRLLVRIVDDDPAARDSLAFMLEEEGFDCAAYPSAEDFLKGDAPSVPGCAILDVRMGKMSGLMLQQEMIRRGITLPIVFLSAHGDIDMAVDTMRSGAVAFLRKGSDRTRLLEAIWSAIERAEGAEPEDAAREVARWQTLTDREREVAERIAAGLLNREIAAELGISPKTVQVYRGEVSRKLDVRGAAGVTRAVRRIEKILAGK